MRRLAGIAVVLLAVAAVGVGAAWFYLHQQFQNPGPLKEEVAVVVPRGAGLVTIGADLSAAGVISDADTFVLGVRLFADATALQAGECQIYTDVDGVYTSDPRIVPQARRLDRITVEEMLEMASLGAKVLQPRSVEFAGKYKVPLRVLSSFEEGPGTLIVHEENEMEQALISGIAFNRDEAKLTVMGVPDQPGVASQILGEVSDGNAHETYVTLLIAGCIEPAELLVSIGLPCIRCRSDSFPFPVFVDGF